MRLIVFLACASSVLGVQWVTENNLQDFLANNTNTLVGYVGSQTCEYDSQFIDEVETAANYLNEKEAKVALINKNYDSTDKTTPTLIFTQLGHQPSSIWWGQSGKEIAQHIKRTPQFDRVFNLTSENEYNILLKRYKIVFFGNFTGYPEKFAEYKKVAEQFNNVFMQLPENSLAFPNMNYSAPSIYAQHYYLKKQLPIKHDSGSLFNWVRNQIHEPVTEITDKNSNHAFRKPLRHIAILFAPKSWANYNELVRNFTQIALLEKGKLAAFYADSGDSENQKLMKFFDVPKKDAKIVIFRTDFKEKGLFTKTCSSTATPYAESNRIYLNNNNEHELIENFRNGIKTL